MAGRYICITTIAAFIIAIYGIFSYMNSTWLISGQMNNNSHAKIDLKSDSFMEEEWMQSRSKVYEERRKRVEQVCANIKKHWVMKNPGNELIVDVNNGLRYCRHAKVCSRRQKKDLNITAYESWSHSNTRSNFVQYTSPKPMTTGYPTKFIFRLGHQHG